MKLAQDVTFVQEIKKSRFICLLRRVESEEEFKAFLKEVQKDYPQATHYCTAWKIKDQARSSDNGEPAGTAGRPMLDVLQNSEVEDIGAIVVRYFGGTLLGKGGLVRAYSSSVRQALEQAEFVKTASLRFYQLRYGYEWIGKIDGWLRASHLEKVQEDFGEEVVSYVLADFPLEDEIASLTSGKAQVLYLKDVISEKKHNSHN